MTQAGELDHIMERASAALADMDYLECEARCLQALAHTRRDNQWGYYARILLPLQESRRQRRMMAAEGTVRLGSTDLPARPEEWLDRIGAAGCMVVTRPHQPEDAAALTRLARERRRHVLTLFADNPANAASWTVRTCVGPPVTITQAAPPSAWCNAWHAADNALSIPVSAAQQLNPSRRPTDWFLDACEALGDAAIARIDASLTGPQRVRALEAYLDAVPDHEKLHQRLADAARAAVTLK